MVGELPTQAQAQKRITGLPVPRRGAIQNGSSAAAVSLISAGCPTLQTAAHRRFAFYFALGRGRGTYSSLRAQHRAGGLEPRTLTQT